MKIGLIDPALYNNGGEPSPNLGDQVISRAVHRELRTIFGEATEIVAIPSHAYPTPRSVALLKDAQYVFVGGSNLLYFRWWRPASWKLGFVGLTSYRDLILMGCGWGGYEIPSGYYGRWVASTVLSSMHAHSVRDEYTRDMARHGLKLQQVINTACPTMWCLTPDFVRSLRRTRANSCIFSLTDYDKDQNADAQFVRELGRLYANDLLFWPQGAGDLEYVRALGYGGPVIERSLDCFLKVLTSGVEYDYVGTRLHAGILCLEHGVRSLVIAIDNRAKEISADTGLPSIVRGDVSGLTKWVEGGDCAGICLPIDSIEAWRRQFMSSSSIGLAS
jgi:polysaccharide pyruvyl transferase WcaK-like protein